MPNRSRWILDQVRERTGKTDWARYSEINRAYRKICLITKFNWLQQSSQSMLRFTKSRTAYPLDMSGMRRLERIWVLTTTNELGWQLLEEVKPQLFEDRVVQFRDSNGNDEEDLPLYYKLTGGPMATLTVTPTPDATYTARVDYLDFHELSVDEEPRSSPMYDDTIAELAAGYVLEAPGGSAEDKQMAQIFMGRALAEFEDVVKDHAPNRTINIDRPARPWIK